MKHTQTGTDEYTDLVPAAGYIRVSTEKQADHYSPGVQRDAIRAYARQHGLALVLIEEDVQRGRVVGRQGYQRILDGVRAGTIQAVVVYMFDRWGRDGAEWAARARELERMRVPFYSVQEGRETGGMMRYMRAGMAEEYSRQLAARVRDARERASTEGRYLAPAMFGYVKRYPEYTGHRKQLAGTLEIEPEEARWVARIFELYGQSGMSQPAIARFLNTSAEAPKAPGGGAWHATRISAILHNPVYIGKLRYNRRRIGYYATSEPGAEFVSEGIHQAIIGMELWAAVQDRLSGKASPVRAYRAPRTLLMGEGILRCAHCGARMAAANLQRDGRQSPTYRCSGRHSGSSACPGSIYSADVAHAALLAQVARLQYQPWDEARAREMVDGADLASELNDVEVQLARARTAMRRHMREYAERDDEPTLAEIQEHRTVGRELAARIEQLEARASELREAPASLDAIRAAHEQLSQVNPAAEVAALVAAHDHERLALMVREFIMSATLDQRVPERHTRWAHADVKWNDDTALLLAMGTATLAPEEAVPVTAYDAKARHREAVRKHRAKQRAVGVDNALATD